MEIEPTSTEVHSYVHTAELLIDWAHRVEEWCMNLGIEVMPAAIGILQASIEDVVTGLQRNGINSGNINDELNKLQMEYYGYAICKLQERINEGLPLDIGRAEVSVVDTAQM